MIKFTCQCGKNYEVPEQYAGKKVRCKKCDGMMHIPCPEGDLPIATPIGIEPELHSPPQTTYDMQSENSSDSENIGLPKPLIYSFVALGIIFVVALLYVFVFRDTWENDNYSEISRLIREAQQHYDYQEFEDGLQKYDELCSLIYFEGDRSFYEFKNEELRERAYDIQDKFEAYERKIEVEKVVAENLKRLLQLEKTGNEYASDGDIVNAIETYNKALVIIRSDRSGEKEFLLAKQRINQVKPELDEIYAAIQEKEAAVRRQEAYEKSMADKGYINYKGKWLSPKEYEREKNRFPAKELRKGMNEYIYINPVIYSYSDAKCKFERIIMSINKGRNYEYSYDISITAECLLILQINGGDFTKRETNKYVFHADSDLNISSNYTNIGGSCSSTANSLFQGLEEVSRSLK